MHVTLAVDDFQAYDHFAHPSPVFSGAVHVGGQYAADALRVVRGKGFECPTAIQEELDHIAHTGSRANGQLHLFRVLAAGDNAGVVIERDQGVVRLDTRVKRVSRTEKPDARRTCYEIYDPLLGRRQIVLLRLIAKPVRPVVEETARNAALEPKILAEGQAIKDDVESGGPPSIKVASWLHSAISC
jgi:hypothetical protein